VAANLLEPLLVTVAARLGAVHLPSRLIAGGLLRPEADRVAHAFAARGLKELDRRSSGDWTALLLRGV
jgi:ribosomal protein L11 methylase PrmA